METETYDHEIIISTGQYENITTHFHGTIAEAAEKSRELRREVKGGDGISKDDFCSVVDTMVAGKPVNGGIELWEKMNEYQKSVCQEIKKSLKRIKSRE